MNKLLKIIGCIWPMVAAYLCQLVVSAIGMAVYLMVIATNAALDGIETPMELQNYILEALPDGNAVLVIGGIAIAVTLLVGALWYKKYRPQENLIFKQMLNPKLFAGAVLMGLALQVLISLCLSVIYPLLPQNTVSEYSDLIETLIGGDTLLSIIVTVLLAPLAEELLFRGVTLEKAKKIMPFFAANIVQALMFGIYHGNLIQGTYAFLLGVLLGYVAEYFHSIWASIFLHACVNGSAQLLSLLPETWTEKMIGIVVLALAGVVFLIAAGKLFRRAKEELPESVQPAGQEEFTKNSFDEYHL